jgi:hypothetical protein
MIDVYVTHYVTDAIPGYNDVAVDCALSLQEVARLDGDKYDLFVLYWTDSDAREADLRRRLPAGATAVKCDSRVQPPLMNRATQIARARGAELFVCLHNDVRPTRGWFQNLVSDVRTADAEHGTGSSVASPRYVPYHWITPPPAASYYPEFWDRLRPPAESKVLSPEAMRAWCKQHDIKFDGRHVVSPKKSYTTNDGHQLMMYCAAPTFFDAVGGCDETFTGLNYGDCDWGLRALKCGKKNLTSQGALLQHISGLTFFNPVVQRQLDDNHQRFIAKWGLDAFKSLQDGSIWRALRT